MLAMQKRGAEVFDYGNNIRACAMEAGAERRVRHPRLRAGVHARRCSAQGKGRSAGSRSRAIRRTSPSPTARCSRAVPGDPDLAPLDRAGAEQRRVPGLPSRICWLGYGDRAKVGLAFNELVRTGKVKAPIVIGRDHLDCGSVASPNRETEAMKDGSDAIADWAIRKLSRTLPTS